MDLFGCFAVGIDPLVARKIGIMPAYYYTPSDLHGNKFIPVYVTENMVGHKLGEFSPTRTFKGHQAKK